MDAVVTLAVGDRGRAIFSLSGPILKSYAERCGCEFVCIENERVNAGDRKFEKLQLYNLLESYQRIIYLDVDTLVMPACPNLLTVVPSGVFGAYFDSNGGNGDAEDYTADLIRADEIASYQEWCGDIGWRKIYFNSGVMILSQNHRELFRYSDNVRRGRRFVDQTLLNYRLQKAGCNWMDIGQRYNHFAALNRSWRLFRTRFDSYIIHYAGFEEYYKELSITEVMRSDIEIIYSKRAMPSENCGG